MEPRKQAILAALRKFAEQRPGMDPRNYGSRRDYCNEAARVTDDLADVRALLVAVGANDGITADMLLQGCGGGRLQMQFDPAGSSEAQQPGIVRVTYITGQYFAVEFRKAVCRLLAAALWTWTREYAMPASGSRDHREDSPVYQGRCYVFNNEQWMSAGDWLRAHFKREFGRRIASRYFD